ncbi:MAG TPA: hypothetical protein VLJ10_01270, partial [Candidatus Bathyarchaeia archaeon]|nr:hypothetical protein [Candidatus Bathyarchaeia archaeon]
MKEIKSGSRPTGRFQVAVVNAEKNFGPSVFVTFNGVTADTVALIAAEALDNSEIRIPLEAFMDLRQWQSLRTTIQIIFSQSQRFDSVTTARDYAMLAGHLNDAEGVMNRAYDRWFGHPWLMGTDASLAVYAVEQNATTLEQLRAEASGTPLILRMRNDVLDLAEAMTKNDALRAFVMDGAPVFDIFAIEKMLVDAGYVLDSGLLEASVQKSMEEVIGSQVEQPESKATAALALSMNVAAGGEMIRNETLRTMIDSSDPLLNILAGYLITKQFEKGRVVDEMGDVTRIEDLAQFLSEYGNRTWVQPLAFMIFRAWKEGRFDMKTDGRAWVDRYPGSILVTQAIAMAWGMVLAEDVAQGRAGMEQIASYQKAESKDDQFAGIVPVVALQALIKKEMAPAQEETGRPGVTMTLYWLGKAVESGTQTVSRFGSMNTQDAGATEAGLKAVLEDQAKIKNSLIEVNNLLSQDAASGRLQSLTGQEKADIGEALNRVRAVMLQVNGAYATTAPSIAETSKLLPSVLSMNHQLDEIVTEVGKRLDRMPQDFSDAAMLTLTPTVRKTFENGLTRNSEMAETAIKSANNLKEKGVKDSSALYAIQRWIGGIKRDIPFLFDQEYYPDVALRALPQQDRGRMVSTLRSIRNKLSTVAEILTSQEDIQEATAQQQQDITDISAQLDSLISVLNADAAMLVLEDEKKHVETIITNLPAGAKVTEEWRTATLDRISKSDDFKTLNQVVTALVFELELAGEKADGVRQLSLVSQGLTLAIDLMNRGYVISAEGWKRIFGPMARVEGLDFDLYGRLA